MVQLVMHIPEDRSSDGPAMSALTDQQRAFVYGMLDSACNPKQADRCALAAGYTGTNPGWRLMRSERILAALHEEAKKKLVGAALLGVTTMMEIANSPQHKDRFRAARELAAINGFTAEQKITVTHIKREEADVIAKIKATAEKLGIDPGPLLAKAGVIDAEFSVVTAVEPNHPIPRHVEVDDSDW